MSIEFIGVDNHVWRIFPPNAYYSVDFERGWTAGIEISQGTILGSTPNWAENLYFRPSQCDRGVCVLGVPSSRGSVPLTLHKKMRMLRLLLGLRAFGRNRHKSRLLHKRHKKMSNS